MGRPCGGLFLNLDLVAIRTSVGEDRAVALLPTKLQNALAALLEKLSGKTEDAYRNRDAANASGDHHAQDYAAGEAHAFAESTEAVRDAQDEAAK
jgi:hypothetical protein